MKSSFPDRESTKLVLWFPVFSETFASNEGREFFSEINRTFWGKNEEKQVVSWALSEVFISKNPILQHGLNEIFAIAQTAIYVYGKEASKVKI